MNRIVRALSAFALTLVMTLSLAATGLCAAAAPASDTPSAGYLVVLRQDLPVYQDDGVLPIDPIGLFAQASLSAAEHERAELMPLAEDHGIYKINAVSDVQNLVWSGQVELVEPDYEAQLFDLDINDPATVNDDFFGDTYQFNLTQTNISSAWDAGLTGEGVTVAVIDTGLNVDHVDAPVKVGRGRYYYYREEKDGRYEFTVNGVTKQYNYYSSDYILDNMGHGSMVSGIIAANTNNRSSSYTGGIAGIAPNATIMPIRCFTATSGHLGGYTSNLISGVDYAMKNGADVINMSWGIVTESEALKKIITEAANAGCILIAAAGNDGTPTLQYPAAWSNVISVGSTNKQGGLSDFSQRTATVDICAPGGTRGGNQIRSIWYTGDDIGKGDGTSFSAPVVVGAATLLKEHDPAMTQTDFLTLLKATSDKSAIAEADRPYAGAGRLDMRKLLETTGHTGTMIRYNADGSVTVRAAHFPVGATPQRYGLVMIGAYNPAGHLLASAAKTSDLSGSKGAYSMTATLDAPEATTLKGFFLDNATLAALGAPAETAISQ